jgi:hypothetical protein
MQQLNETIGNAVVEKWRAILESSSFEPIVGIHKQRTTAQLLENQEKFLKEEALSTNMQVGGTFDPVLIPLVRRMAPKLIAYDLCGVQAMNMPTGLVFAMRSRYTDKNGAESLYNEADTKFGGDTTATVGAGAFPLTDTGAADTTWGYAGGKPTATGETETWASMSMTIEKTTVEAKTRQLKAEYSLELAQDLRSVHGLDAELELTNILSTEIIAEINREVVRRIYTTAKIGAAWSGTAPGVINLQSDTDGRWSVERFKGLMFGIEKDANRIASETRRGKGNILICGADVASALNMIGLLSNYSPNLQSMNDLVVDATGATFAGMINGKFKVFVDPYMAANAYVVGFKGENAYDAGFFYCPYVPLQQFKAIDPNNFQPQIGFKTRYGIVANPFTSLADNANVYYRKAKILNLS